MLDVIAGIMGVAVDPDGGWWSHQMREVTGKRRVESRAPEFLMNAARMRQVMSHDDRWAGESSASRSRIQHTCSRCIARACSGRSRPWAP